MPYRPPFLLSQMLPTAFCLAIFAPLAFTQDQLPEYREPDGELISQESGWESWRDAGSTTLQRRVLQLAPRAEPKPALSVQLIPDEFHRKDGNAAIFYLQAMGFFEQTNAQRAKADFERESYDAAVATGKGPGDFPPHSWREMRPADLPIEQVKQYVAYTSFQTRYIREAVQRERCDFDRHIGDVENPIMYLLPEIQSMRELARQQSLRFLLAIAEDRTEDAVEILGQQLAMAPHLAQEPFLVSSLVGIACASIGWSDALYLCEHPAAPNLYWAIAALPQPLADLRPALAYEREFLFEQFKLLREVDETPRSNLYWSRFVDQLRESLAGVSNEMDQFQQFGSSGLSLAVAMGVPGARRYLHEVIGMPIEDLDRLPNTQVFFLAVRRYHERARDEMFKCEFVPEWMRDGFYGTAQQRLQDDMQEFGVITSLSGLFLPATGAAMSAQTRLQQKLALLQTVESIRHHLATHDKQLPDSLDALALPAPPDPATGKPFEYQRHNRGATLTGSPFPGIRSQLELRVP